MKITLRMMKNLVIVNLLGAPGSHQGGPCGFWEAPGGSLGAPGKLDPRAPGSHLGGPWRLRSHQRTPGGARELAGGPGEVWLGTAALSVFPRS